MNEEQKKALALARARRRRMEATGDSVSRHRAADEIALAQMAAADNEARDPGLVGSVLSSGAQGSTLGFADEILGGLGAAGGAVGDVLTGNWGGIPERAGERYAGIRDSARDLQARSEEFHPYVSTGTEIAGGLVPALAAAGVVGAGSTLPAMIGRGALTGAAEGAAYGFGTGEGMQDRLQGGAVGGVLGGLIGGAAPVVADIAGRGVRGVSDWARNRNVSGTVADALGVDRGTGRALSELVGAQDPNTVAAALARSGDDAMLADVPGLTGILDTTMRSPTPGATMATGRIGERAALAGDEIMDALRGGQQGPFVGPVATERAISKQGRATVNPLYERAYNTAVDYASPEGMAIEELISRVPPKQLAKAVQDATDQMIYDGLPNPQVLMEIAEDGTVKLAQLPNVMQLDYIKRAFDNIAEAGKDPLTGALTPDARFAARVARDVREATKAAVPEYGEALDAAATGIRARGAVREGGKLLDPSMTVETALEVIEGATEAEKRLMRDGLAAQIEHRIGNIKAVGSDPNIDAREAASAWSTLSSKNTQDKLAALFGDEWPAMKETMDRAGAAVGLRASTSANSATAGRQAASELIDEITQPGALRSGQPVQAARNFVGGITGASPDAVARLKQNIRSELADVLTRQGGSAQDAVRVIAQALAKNPMNMAAGKGVEEIVRLLGMTSIPATAGAANDRIR